MYASRTGNSIVADRINDIICLRESLPPLSDDEDLSCDEDQEITQHSLQPSIPSLQQKQQRISSNSFRFLKKLPSSYRKSSSYKETSSTKTANQQQDDDEVLSDDSCGTKNETPGGSHGQEVTSFDEENNTLQLFDDSEDTNNDTQEKTREPLMVSKRIKPILGMLCVYLIPMLLLSDILASQSVKANPFNPFKVNFYFKLPNKNGSVLILKVTDTKVDSVEPPKRRTSFLENITTSAVEEANMKTRKRQGSDTDGECQGFLHTAS